MQNSTDTLVEEALLKSALVNNGALLKTSSDSSKREPLIIDTHTASSSDFNNANANGSTTGSNGESSQSSTSTSTIPSPTLSTANLKHLMHKNEIDSAQNKNRTLKTISTSTSGLSDFVESSKFRYLNDTIKYFEKNFNNNCDLVNGINSIGDEYLSSLNIFNGNNGNSQNDFFINEFNNFKVSSKENENPKNSQQLEVSTLLKSSTNKARDCNRKASNSIPIVKKNSVTKS